MNNKEQEKCIHQKTDRLQLTSNFSLCFHCSSGIINNGAQNEVSTVKPRKYSVILENSIPIFLSIYDTHNSYSFLNKADYMSIRIIFIKQMKIFCNNFNLNIKTYFLSVDYFDRICAKLKTFEVEALKQISLFCIVLASKFQENSQKWREIQKYLNIDSITY